MECVACQNFYNADLLVPRVLSCGHTFCGQCVKLLLDFSPTEAIVCVVCRLPHYSKVTSPIEVPYNFALLDLMFAYCRGGAQLYGEVKGPIELGRGAGGRDMASPPGLGHDIAQLQIDSPGGLLKGHGPVIKDPGPSTSHGPVTEHPGPSTSRGPVTEHPGPSTSRGPVTEHPGPSTSRGPVTEHPGPSTSRGPVTEHPGPSTSRGPVTEHPGPSTSRGPVTEHPGPSTSRGPVTEHPGPSTSRGPVTEHSGPSTSRGPETEHPGPSTSRVPGDESKVPSASIMPAVETAGPSASIVPGDETSGSSSSAGPGKENSALSTSLITNEPPQPVSSRGKEPVSPRGKETRPQGPVSPQGSGMKRPVDDSPQGSAVKHPDPVSPQGRRILTPSPVSPRGRGMVTTDPKHRPGMSSPGPSSSRGSEIMPQVVAGPSGHREEQEGEMDSSTDSCEEDEDYECPKIEREVRAPPPIGDNFRVILQPPPGMIWYGGFLRDGRNEVFPGMQNDDLWGQHRVPKQAQIVGNQRRRGKKLRKSYRRPSQYPSADSISDYEPILTPIVF